MAYSTPITAASHASNNPHVQPPPGRLGLRALSLDRSQHSPGASQIEQLFALSGDVAPQYNLNRRQNSTRQSISVSPAQNPRVSNIINGTGSPSASPTQQQRFYASSAPSSSTALFNASNSSPRARPPVPLFQSTGNIHQQQNLTATSNNNTTDMDTDFDFSLASASGGGEAPNFFDEPLDCNAMHTFEPINHPAPASGAQTVSPKDIMGDNISAPPSTTFTELTTPGTSYEQSPYGMLDTSETSPLFSEADLDQDAQNWPSLFETTEVTDDFTPQPAANTNTGSKVTASYHASPRTTHVAPKMSRNDSSPGSSSKGGRHSFTSGVGAKRRDKPLPEIHVEDPNDTTAIKRARNTMAARKSRQKRMERTEQLESQVQELSEEVEHWKAIALSRGHAE